MRNLAQALLITLGCFSAAGVYAQEDETSSEVVISSEGSEETSQNRNFNLLQQEEVAEDESTKN